MLKSPPSVNVGHEVHKELLFIAITNSERGGEIRFMAIFPINKVLDFFSEVTEAKQYPSVMVNYEARLVVRNACPDLCRLGA